MVDKAKDEETEVVSEKSSTDTTKKSTKKKISKKTVSTERSKVGAKSPQPKRYTFEQWLIRRNVPSHHRGGMRAYVKSKKLRTLEQWDEVMKNY